MVWGLNLGKLLLSVGTTNWPKMNINGSVQSELLVKDLSFAKCKQRNANSAPFLLRHNLCVKLCEKDNGMYLRTNIRNFAQCSWQLHAEWAPTRRKGYTWSKTGVGSFRM